MIVLLYLISSLLFFSCGDIINSSNSSYHNDDINNDENRLTSDSTSFSIDNTSSHENNALSFLDLVHSIPNYYQRSTHFGGFPDGGSAYCGPAAASNALMWLYQNDSGKIIAKSGNAVKDQYELIKLLGSQKYFNTNRDGTNPSELCLGLSKFFDDHDIKNVKIEYHGWRRMDSRFKSGHTVINLDTMKNRLQQGNAVLFNYGWYIYDEPKDEYTRTGGHWVTLTGFGHDGNKENPDVLIVNDPDIRVQSPNHIFTKKIESGTLKGQLSGLPRKAQGFHKFKPAAKGIGIIDGAVVIGKNTTKLAF